MEASIIAIIAIFILLSLPIIYTIFLLIKYMKDKDKNTKYYPTTQQLLIEQNRLLREQNKLLKK